MQNPNPFAPPTAEVADVRTSTEVEYVGFWARVSAAIMDTLLLVAVTYPALIAFYGWAVVGKRDEIVHGPMDLFLNWVLPALVSIAFWLSKQATPGKMMVRAKVVDARTLGPISVKQSILRYLGYYVALLPLGVGILWVAFDPRKQGWHDKLAGTVVVRR